jgi:Glycosyl transferases group 1
MQHSDLHIVSFDVPTPPDYGGVVDIFWKLHALKQLGVKVNLHVFAYNDRKTFVPHLKEMAHEVHVYERPLGMAKQLSSLPYIVNTRKSPDLLRNLVADAAPILYEGIHTTGWLGHKDLENRKQAIRVHNREADYYADLANLATDTKTRLFQKIESAKLRRYESGAWEAATKLYPLNRLDADSLPNAKWLPAFYDDMPLADLAESKTEQDYLLFHGNLAVSDNEQSAVWLIETLADQPQHKFVIAGKNPSRRLAKLVSQYSHISLFPNPDELSLQSLLLNCKAHLVWTFQDAGVKLKLLHALKTGRPVICPPLMVAGSGLEQAVYLAEDTETLKNLLKKTNLPSTATFSSWQNIYSNKRGAEFIMNDLCN